MREIGRLRLKFIIYNMLVVTAVIGITFCAVTSVVKHRVNDQGSLALSRVVAGEEQSLIFAAMSPARIPFFTVLVGEDGAVTLGEGYDAYWEPEYLEQMAVLGMTGEEDMGILDAYHLRYLRISQPAGHMIAFADTTYEDSLRNGVMKYGAMACVAIWLGFFGLSYFFSRWAVKPLEESVRMQKQFVADASHELKTPLTVITANAALLQEQLGGANGELKAALQYMSQSFRIKDTEIKDLFLDIAAEELGHMEMVATTINMLNGHDVDYEKVEAGEIQSHVLLGLNPGLINASGYSWTGDYVTVTGDLCADLLSNIASEQRAKVVYEYLYRQIDDKCVKETIDFLLNREEAHNTMFKKAFNKVQNTGSNRDFGTTKAAKMYFSMSEPSPEDNQFSNVGEPLNSFS